MVLAIYERLLLRNQLQGPGETTVDKEGDYMPIAWT